MPWPFLSRAAAKTPCRKTPTASVIARQRARTSAVPPCRAQLFSLLRPPSVRWGGGERGDGGRAVPARRDINEGAKRHADFGHKRQVQRRHLAATRCPSQGNCFFTRFCFFQTGMFVSMVIWYGDSKIFEHQNYSTIFVAFETLLVILYLRSFQQELLHIDGDSTGVGIRVAEQKKGLFFSLELLRYFRSNFQLRDRDGSDCCVLSLRSRPRVSGGRI